MANPTGPIRLRHYRTTPYTVARAVRGWTLLSTEERRHVLADVERMRTEDVTVEHYDAYLRGVMDEIRARVGLEAWFAATREQYRLAAELRAGGAA